MRIARLLIMLGAAMALATCRDATALEKCAPVDSVPCVAGNYRLVRYGEHGLPRESGGSNQILYWAASLQLDTLQQFVYVLQFEQCSGIQGVGTPCTPPPGPPSDTTHGTWTIIDENVQVLFTNGHPPD